MRNPLSFVMMLALSPGCEPAGPDQAVVARPPSRTVEALVLAYQDERRAEAFYEAVMERFGEVRPFSNIIHAERRHQQMLLPLFERYGVDPPAGPVEIPEVPATLREACRVGIESEVENIGLYDRLLGEIEDEGVRSAFERLQWASRERHLPAFRRCAERGGGRGHAGGGRGRP